MKLGQHELQAEGTCDYRLQPWCMWDLRSPGILRIFPGGRRSEITFLRMNLTLINFQKQCL